MQDWGDDLSQFDLIVALSPASQRMALELTRFHHLDIEYWPILDPTGLGETREAKLAAYRQARDQIRERMLARFGAPTEGWRLRFDGSGCHSQSSGILPRGASKRMRHHTRERSRNASVL
jgi:hypothetical protein